MKYDADEDGEDGNKDTWRLRYYGYFLLYPSGILIADRLINGKPE